MFCDPRGVLRQELQVSIKCRIWDSGAVKASRVEIDTDERGGLASSAML
jgi:hypothetical protein